MVNHGFLNQNVCAVVIQVQINNSNNIIAFFGGGGKLIKYRFCEFILLVIVLESRTVAML
jgi:hypothetical protein